MAPVAQRRGLRFNGAVATDVPDALHGDPLRIKQILLNLLGNAIKFTEHGSVGLHVSVQAPIGVRFEVRDTGPGLSAEQQSRLFRRFEQAEGRRTAARYGGSGLGLAICQQLALAMGGCIEVDSAPGQGTLLPWSSCRCRVATHGGASTRGAPVRPMRPRELDLLLVEDDPTVAEVMIGLLQAQGHRVTPRRARPRGNGGSRRMRVSTPHCSISTCRAWMGWPWRDCCARRDSMRRCWPSPRARTPMPNRSRMRPVSTASCASR